MKGEIFERMRQRTLAIGNLQPIRTTAFLCLLSSACGAGNPTSPTVSQPTPALRIIADPVVALTQGDSVALRIQEAGAEQPAANYTWTSSDATLVTATGGILQASSGFGGATVTAVSPTGLTTSVLVWVQPPETRTSTYRITLVYADDVPEAWRLELDAAATRWQRVIRSELPAMPIVGVPSSCMGGETPPPPLTGLESGTRIFVSTSGTFPDSDYAEAIAAQCLQRPMPHPTSLFGRIILNRKKPIQKIPMSRRQYLALHEMGHVIGLVGPVQPTETTPWFDATTGRYTGALALEGFRRDFGTTISHLTVTHRHWGFPDDIMGGLQTRISSASVGALMDLGYPAAWYGADR